MSEFRSGFRVVRGSPASRVCLVVLLALIAVLTSVPSWAEAATQRRMVELFTLLSLAQMWNLLAGFAGLVSVGQQAFVGLGAYGMVALVNVHGQNLYWSVPISAFIAAVLSIPIALVAFRLRGSYFAIGTWVIAEVASLIIVQQTSLGAGSGVSLKVAGFDLETRQHATYWLALVAGVGALLIAYLILRSKLGLQMQAIRDDEAGARGLGANVYRTRLIVWVIASFWTAFTGAVYYLSNLRVQPKDSFSVANWTAPIVIIVVIGGIGTLEGPVIGALVYYILREYFKDYHTWYTVGSGVVAVAAALYLQPGIWGTIRRALKVDLFPVRRRLVRQADTHVENGG